MVFKSKKTLSSVAESLKVDVKEEKLKPTTIYMSDEVKRRMKIRVAELGIKQTDYINDLIKKDLGL